MDTIFVFGSNLSGKHGGGAAITARRVFGAQNGIGEGLTGNAYAIPTKDKLIMPLPLDTIKQHVDKFIRYARLNPGKFFIVTRVGCGLAGYKDEEMAPMFKGLPTNCLIPVTWAWYLTEERRKQEIDSHYKYPHTS